MEACSLTSQRYRSLTVSPHILHLDASKVLFCLLGIPLPASGDKFLLNRTILAMLLFSIRLLIRSCNDGCMRLSAKCSQAKRTIYEKGMKNHPTKQQQAVF